MTKEGILPSLPEDGILIKNGMSKLEFVVSLFEYKRVKLTLVWKEGKNQKTKKVWCRFRSIIERYNNHSYKDDWMGTVEIHAGEKTYLHTYRYYTFNTKTLEGTIGKNDGRHLGGGH